MKKCSFGRSGLMMAVLGVASASLSWGGHASCNNTSSPTAFSATPPAIGVTGGAGTINDPKNSYTAGCTAVDDLFSNFSSNSTVSTFATAETESNPGNPTFGFTATGTFGADPTLNGIFVTPVSNTSGTGIKFTAPCTGTGCDAGSGAAWYSGIGSSQSTVFDYAVDSSKSVTGLSAGTTMSNATLFISIGEVTGGPAGRVEVIENICEGTTTWSTSCAAHTSITLSGSGEGSGTTQTLTGTASFATPVTDVAIQTLIELSTPFGEEVYLTSFTEEFDTPEPSAFLLLGTGLKIILLLCGHREVRFLREALLRSYSLLRVEAA